MHAGHRETPRKCARAVAPTEKPTGKLEAGGAVGWVTRSEGGCWAWPSPPPDQLGRGQSLVRGPGSRESPPLPSSSCPAKGRVLPEQEPGCSLAQDPWRGGPREPLGAASVPGMHPAAPQVTPSFRSLSASRHQRTGSRKASPEPCPGSRVGPHKKAPGLNLQVLRPQTLLHCRGELQPSVPACGVWN